MKKVDHLGCTLFSTTASEKEGERGDQIQSQLWIEFEDNENCLRPYLNNKQKDCSKCKYTYRFSLIC